MSTAVPINDARLEELAAEPVEDLLPGMKFGAAFTPWLMVLAFLPPLAGVLVWTLDERSAEWGLRALDAVQVEETEFPILWHGTEYAPSLVGAPPLATWLTAALMSVIGIDPPLGLMGVSYLAVAFTILTATKLALRLGVPRLAFLTAVCCAGQPLLLNSAHACGPEALGLCLLTLSFERFLAHLDGSVGIWSGRLLAGGVAWGGSWLALGWPALSLGVALAIHALVFADRRANHVPAGEFREPGFSPMQKFRQSLLVWWLIGLATGGWWILGAVREVGFAPTFAWFLNSAPNRISPLYDSAQWIGQWGGSVGQTFLMGWMALGIFALLRNWRNVLSDSRDGRGIALLLWWVSLLVCRVTAAASGADPTLWDVLQAVPACVAAAIGMETVLQRSLTFFGLACGIGVGLISLSAHVPRVDTPAIHGALIVGIIICLLPLAINLLQARSFRWNEAQVRLALRGLIFSTWIAHCGWGVAQSLPGSLAESQLANQLAKVSETAPQPGAIVVVSNSDPPESLLFQLRRRWPEAPIVTADRWEAAVSKSVSKVRNWAETEFLVVELTRRDSQFRRPGTGWTVTGVGEPRRYHGEILTMHRVSMQRP